MSLQRLTRSPIVLERGVTGRVKWFDFWKGYGFITRDDGGPDVFLHASAIVRKVQMHFVLIEGQKLEFDIIDGEKGREAAVVSGPGGIRVGTAIRYNPQQQMAGGKNFKRTISDGGRTQRIVVKQKNKTEKPQLTKKADKNATGEKPELTKKAAKSASGEKPELTKKADKSASGEKPELTKKADKSASGEEPELTKKAVV